MGEKCVHLMRWFGKNPLGERVGTGGQVNLAYGPHILGPKLGLYILACASKAHTMVRWVDKSRSADKTISVA